MTNTRTEAMAEADAWIAGLLRTGPKPGVCWLDVIFEGRGKGPSAHGITPLHLAVHQGRLDALWSDGASSVDVPDHRGNTPLHWAARAGREIEVGRLLAFGANANAPNFAGQTALHVAAEQGSVACLQRLLDAGASRTLLDDAARSAWDRAEPFSPARALLDGWSR